MFFQALCFFFKKKWAQAPFPQGPLDISLFRGFPKKSGTPIRLEFLGEENLIFFPPLKLSVILGHFLRVLSARLSSLNPKLVTSRPPHPEVMGDLLGQLGYKANSLSQYQFYYA